MKILTRAVVLTLALWSLSALPAAAMFADGNVNQTMGSDGYVGTQASADFGGALHFQPSFEEYHGDGTKGYTYRTYSLRAAYDQKTWGLGLSGGATPTIDGYNNYFFGADGVLSLTPGGGPPLRAAAQASNPYYWGPESAGLGGVDLRAGVNEIHNGEGSTFWQDSHFRQESTKHPTPAKSPSLNFFTSFPTRVTRPAISCPGTMG